MKKHFFAIISLLVASSAMQAADDIKVTSLSGYTSRSYPGRVSCHDPSIFMDTISSSTPTYYILGSHHGRGKTTNLSNVTSWTYPSDFGVSYTTHAVKTIKDVDGNDVAFGNFDAHAWQYKGYNVGGNEWAPDVIYNKTMKKWCMYMSLNGDKWCSSIVCFVADKPTGPWVYQGPVVFSGFQGTYEHNGFAAANDYKKMDLEIAIGSQSTLPARYKCGSSWGSYWPNCIDPCVFYDDDDNLWMSYGSWSGGIFMLKLNPENGLRDYQYKYDYKINGVKATPGSASSNCTSDPYFGLKIAGGYYVSGEASYIEKIGNYYFLFMSYGGLEAAGGYQMRIFRSTSPLGPYKDIAGNSALYSSYQLNYGSKSASNRGVLLMGGYKWDTMPDAELAQGHNSAFSDKQGRSFVVYHTRFANGGEGHQVRVHQLFLNQDGWLVSMPFEFTGETVTQEKIETSSLYTNEEIVGTYQLIRHTYCQNTAAKAYQVPTTIVLHEDGTVTGAYSGTWSVPEGTSFINLKLGTVTYNGVLEKQTIDYTSSTKALSIAAVSSSSGSFTNTSSNTKGLEIWATKTDERGAISFTYSNLSIPLKKNITNTVTDNIILPTKGFLGTTVSWSSSDPSVITSTGQLVGNGEAVMTMSISKDGYVYQSDYKVKVSTDITTYYPKVGAEDYSTGYLSAFSEPYTLQKGEVANFHFVNYCKSGNTSNWLNWILCCYNNEARSTNYFILRADRWEDKSSGYNGCTSDFDWNTFATDMSEATVDMSVSYTAEGSVVMNSKITTKAGKVYNYSYTYPTTLSLNQIVLYFSVNQSYISSQEATGIYAPEVDADIEKHIVKGIYDLKGHSYMTMPTRKGVYIVGGKKVVVR